MSRQLSFSFEQICGEIDAGQEGKAAVRAFKRAVRTLTAKGGHVSLADIMHAIRRREGGKDPFDRVSLAVASWRDRPGSPTRMYGA